MTAPLCSSSRKHTSMLKYKGYGQYEDLVFSLRYFFDIHLAPEEVYPPLDPVLPQHLPIKPCKTFRFV